MQKNDTAPLAVVVGAANADIGGIPDKPLVMRDSNPGRIEMSLGGVGRNIAHNLALLETRVELVTALGEDGYAPGVEAGCREHGIGLRGALRVPQGRTSVYLFIGDENGDMALALNDMEIYKALSPEFLKSRQELFGEAGLVILDTNIPEESIAWLCENCPAPLMADPVSTVKASKLKPRLGLLHSIKPNRMEAELLSGIPIKSPENAKKAAEFFLEKGLKRVFISLGADGVCAGDESGVILLPAMEAATVNATGAGDAMTAALAWGFLEGMGLEETARAGQAAAVIALESRETVAEELSPVNLWLKFGDGQFS